MATSSKNSVLLWGRRLIYVMGGVGLIASITILFGAQIIIRVFLGPGYDPSITVLKILSALPFIMALSDVLSNQIMLPFNKDSFYAMIRVLTATLHVALALLIVPRLQEDGIALVFILSQSFILVTTFLFLWYWELTPMHYKVEKKISNSLINSGH